MGLAGPGIFISEGVTVRHLGLDAGSRGWAVLASSWCHAAPLQPPLLHLHGSTEHRAQPVLLAGNRKAGAALEDNKIKGQTA